jgi:hypothetical protein
VHYRLSAESGNEGGGLETTMHMLTKPFSLETLASRVEAIIGKS